MGASLSRKGRDDGGYVLGKLVGGFNACFETMGLRGTDFCEFSVGHISWGLGTRGFEFVVQLCHDFLAKCSQLCICFCISYLSTTTVAFPLSASRMTSYYQFLISFNSSFVMLSSVSFELVEET